MYIHLLKSLPSTEFFNIIYIPMELFAFLSKLVFYLTR